MQISRIFSIIQDYPLAARFSLRFFLLKIISGIAIIVLLLWLNYYHNKEEMNKVLNLVHENTERTLATGIWLTNDEAIEALLDGLVAIPWIEHVTVILEEGETIERGKVISEKTIQHGHELYYEYRGKTVFLGSLRIEIGLDQLSEQLWDQGVIITALIFLLVLASLFVSFSFVHLSIGKHLHAIAEYCVNLDIGTLDVPLELKRHLKARGKEDELDHIVFSLNNMRISLMRSLEQIRARDVKYRSIVQNTSDAFLVIDRQFRISYANPAAHNEFGGFIKHGLEETGIGKVIQQAVGCVLADGKPNEIYFDYTTSQGKQHFEMRLSPNGYHDGTIFSVVGIARNITVRKRSEGILKVAFDHSPMLMSISDIETGRFIEVNDRFLKTTGYALNQIIGEYSVTIGFIQSEDRERIKRYILEHGFFENFETQIKKADGTYIIGRLYGQVVDIKDKKVLLLIIDDVSEQKRILQERKELERQLQHGMKMEAIGTLAGGIAHDFNNILSAIMGYGQLAIEQVPEGGSVHHDLSQVLTAGERAAELVRQILAFSRQEQDEFLPVRFQPLIKEVAKLLRATLPVTIELKLDIHENTGEILADQAQLHQVLMNLCTNARQAIGNQHGVIRISLREIISLPNTLYSIGEEKLKAGPFLLLEVCDSGEGIKPEVIARIFDPFFTTKGKEHGTGLGLAVTHGIVVKHKGAITVKSTPGVGTSFLVYLPIVAAEGRRVEAIPAENLCGDEHILIVDDEQMIVHILERSLKNMGYTVSAFTDSKKALDYFQVYSGDVDLVVTDMTMPGLTGLAIYREMLLMCPNVKAILCTGFSEIIDEEAASREGFIAYLRKPVVGKDVARVVREVAKTRNREWSFMM